MSAKIKQLPVILHIGYHKTATTYLQNLVFPEHPQLLYPGRPFRTRAISDFFLNHQFTHPLLIEPDVMRDEFYKVISNWVESSGLSALNKNALLVSHESLHSGPEWFGADVTMMAGRLKAIFPDAKIILGIRNQRDYIESNYKQYVILGGKLSFSAFTKGSFAFNYGLLPKLHYEKLIGEYFRLYGKDNVYVYLLEDFKTDLFGELNKIMGFMNLSPLAAYKTDKVNSGLSKISCAFIRNMNCLLAGDFNEQYYNWMNHKISWKEKLRWRVVRILKKLEASNMVKLNKRLSDEKTNNEFKERFSTSNKVLSKILNKDLSKLGYYS